MKALNKLDHLGANTPGQGMLIEKKESVIRKRIGKTQVQTRRRPKRGRYRKYTYSLKKEAVELSLKLGDAVQASKIMNVPLKNLRRWIENGPRRKKGGRKTHDPQMEVKLYNWIINYRQVYNELPSRKQIKKTALEYSHFPNKFKASKGWYEKFMLRHFSDKRKNTHSEEWEELKRRILLESHTHAPKTSRPSHPLSQSPKTRIHERLFSVWEEFLSGENHNPIEVLRKRVKHVLQNILERPCQGKVQKKKAKADKGGLSYLLDRAGDGLGSMSHESRLLISEEESLVDAEMKGDTARNESQLFSDQFLNRSILKAEEGFGNESGGQSSGKISMNPPKPSLNMEPNSNILRNLDSLCKNTSDNCVLDAEANGNRATSNRSGFPLQINNLTESNENRLETDTQKTKKLYSPKLFRETGKNNKQSNQNQSGMGFSGLNAGLGTK